MLEIIGYMFCVYFVFKGIEIHQIGVASRPEKTREALLTGTIMFFAGLLAAVIFAFLLHSQAQSIPTPMLP
jgi:uncharacterized membrane protein